MKRFPAPVRWITIRLDDESARFLEKGADVLLVLRDAAREELRIEPLDYYAQDGQGDVIVDSEIVEFVAKRAKEGTSA